MKPQLFGLSTYFMFWGAAAVGGIWSGLRLAREAGFRRRQPFIALLVFALAIIAGSKLLYLVEHVFFPLDDPVPVSQDDFVGLMRHGFRIPGGMLLLAAALPLTCRLLRLPALRFGDTVMPAAGIAICCIRIGCFMNGCCHGGLTNSILGVSFPQGARAYEWQLLQGDIAWPATRTLPIHPLQLYFAALGVALYLLGRHWQRTKRFDGQVWINFYIAFFAGTFVLEFLRPAPLHLNLVLTATVVALTAWIGMRARQALPTAADASW